METQSSLKIMSSEDCFEPTSSVSIQRLDPSVIKEAAARLIEQAVEANGPLEPRLKYLSEINQGVMRGLEFKIKPINSLVRKMSTMWNPTLTLDELCEKQYDVLRYTMEIPLERYTDAVVQVLQQLKDMEGCVIVELKNYWGCVTYRGINGILRTNSGVKFELQFHTPASFDQKQNKTHILYEALRRETDAVKQNLFFADMMSLWDNVYVPPQVEKIGTSRTQEIPNPKSVTEIEQKTIDRVRDLKQSLRANVTEMRQCCEKADRYLIPFVEYVAGLVGFEVKELDNRFKGALKIRRKIEDELRKKLKLPISAELHEVELPPKVGQLPLTQYIHQLTFSQNDILQYRLVCNDTEKYTNSVISLMDVMEQNGFEIIGVDNYWQDMEKHHPIYVQFNIPKSHIIPVPCRFSVEFHTSASYECVVERRTALTHIEERMYEKGETYNKTAADMQVRFDATMLRHWARVQVPPGAEKIGCLREQSLDVIESETITPWKTPTRRYRDRLAAIQLISCMAIGFVIGVSLAKFRTPNLK